MWNYDGSGRLQSGIGRGGRGMSISRCAVYQVKETPEYRDVRFRS